MYFSVIAIFSAILLVSVTGEKLSECSKRDEAEIADYKTKLEESRQLLKAIECIKIDGDKERRKPGYDYLQGYGSYRLVPESKTWDEARSECIRDGAHLAIVDNVEEEQHLVSLVTACKEISINTGIGNVAWVGTRKLKAGKEAIKWTNVCEEEPVYQKWTNLPQSDAECGIISGNNQKGISSQSCNLSGAYICEL